MEWHRPLAEEDVATAHALRTQHQPGPPDGGGRQYCAAATHLVYAPRWPCQRAHWAAAVLAAEERGEVAGSNVRGIGRVVA